jgi:hypothetical protein
MAIAATPWARAAGVLLGAAAVAAVLASWAPSGAQPVAGTTVSLTVNRAATLDVAPAGAILTTSLMPGTPRTASVRLRNIGDRPSQVRLRIEPATGDADPYLGFEIRADGRRVYRGPLGGLRTWTGTALHLRSGQAVELTIAVSLLDTLPAAAELPEQDLTIETLEQPWAR